MKLKIKLNDETYEVEVGDLNARPILATIDGETFEVYPEEAEVQATEAQTLASTPPPTTRVVTTPVSRPVVTATPVTGVAGLVTAPLPGVIVAVAVKEGADVTKGQEVVTLEAMKMKNSIRAPRGGKVIAVHVNAGDHVKHGQPLLEIGD